MKLQPPEENYRSELTILPMVNVVFLLLIFFMLVGRIAPGDTANVSPPVSTSGETPSEQPMRIGIMADGSMVFNARAVEMSALSSMVADTLRQDSTASFQLEADAALDADSLIRVMETLRRLGIRQLTLLTELER